MQRRGVKIDRHARDERQHEADVSPKEWNTGSTLKTLSSRPKSIRAAACATFASMFVWLKTTPLGTPSDPDVNRITARSKGLATARGFS